LGLIVFWLAAIGCEPSDARRVVVYTSLDPILSQPIIAEFERSTGITVDEVFDTETTKTTGLTNRLIAEKSNPRCDVFWNSEISRTLALKNEGVLVSYRSPSGEDIPAEFKDPEGYWHGFGARARVIVYNRELVSPEEAPNSIFDLAEEKWRKRTAIANPLFGTTTTQMEIFFEELGPERAKRFLMKLKENEVAVVASNSASKDMVGRGELAVGYTDTDDVLVGQQAGYPIDMVFPDQEGMGTLLIPNTVALIAGGPNPEEGKSFIDYVLSRQVEEELAKGRGGQIPLRPGVPGPPGIPSVEDLKWMKVDFAAAAQRREEVAKFIQEEFLD